MDWNIAKTHRECVCGKVFEENDTYFAALFEEEGGFVRRDYCAACWEPVRAEGKFFSFWRAMVPPKEQKRQFFYLLSLILMRKKILKFEDVERDGEDECLILRMPSEDRSFRVRDPKLSNEQTDSLKEQLAQILDFQL